MNERMIKSIIDAWSRDFNVEAAIDYVRACTERIVTEAEVLTVYSDMDNQYNQWLEAQ